MKPSTKGTIMTKSQCKAATRFGFRFCVSATVTRTILVQSAASSPFQVVSSVIAGTVAAYSVTKYTDAAADQLVEDIAVLISNNS